MVGVTCLLPGQAGYSSRFFYSCFSCHVVVVYVRHPAVQRELQELLARRVATDTTEEEADDDVAEDDSGDESDYGGSDPDDSGSHEASLTTESEIEETLRSFAGGVSSLIGQSVGVSSTDTSGSFSQASSCGHSLSSHGGTSGTTQGAADTPAASARTGARNVTDDNIRIPVTPPAAAPAQVQAPSPPAPAPANVPLPPPLPPTPRRRGQGDSRPAPSVPAAESVSAPTGSSAPAEAAVAPAEPVPEPVRLKCLMTVLRRLGVPVMELAFFPKQERSALVVRDPNEVARCALHATHALKGTFHPGYPISDACEAGVGGGARSRGDEATAALAALIASGEDHGRDSSGRKLRLRWGALSSADMDALVRVRPS